MKNIDEILLEELDEKQKEAVLINKGSLLVFAGAGSGKTRVITTKIAWIIKNRLANPWEILAVTFTNKACNEMRERVCNFLGEEIASQCMIKTFHSFGIWFLHRYREQSMLSPNFTVYDDKDSSALLHQCFPTLERYETEKFSKRISALKDSMQKPMCSDEIFKYYVAYQNKLRQTGNVDFADMILLPIDMLKKNKDIQNYIHNRFKVILVDEYQDSNVAQFNLLRLLTGPSTFLCVVGDDDQSIYRFRGANVENILNFTKEFQQTRTVILGCNYRCTEKILNCANDIITKNNFRAEKKLFAYSKEGKKPVLYLENTEYDEAQQIVNIIKSSTEQTGSTAVIYRTNAQSKVFEDRFLINSIPYVLVGSLRFYEREEIKDAIALISLLVNPFNSVAFERIVNKPSRGIGNTSVNKIFEYGKNLISASETLIKEHLIKGKTASGLENFIQIYNECLNLVGNMPNNQLVETLITKFGIKDMYLQRDEDETVSYSRTENLGQLVNMFTENKFVNGFEGLLNFLESISLDPSSLGEQDSSENENSITLITMHNTKGLEYDRVFVVGLEDEIFPSLRENWKNADLEEERRLCYVAFTRAKKELYLFSCASRMLWGKKRGNTPSRFLDEIDAKHIDIVDHRDPKYFLESAHNYRNYNNYKSKGSYINNNSDFYSDSYRAGGSDNFNNFNSFNSFNRQAKPKLFSSYNANDYESYLPQKFRNFGKSKIQWKIGDRVQNSILGNGTITEIKKFGEREILAVSFDDGRTASFVSSKADLIRI